MSSIGDLWTVLQHGDNVQKRNYGKKKSSGRT